MRVVFLGTPQFAVPTLEKLVECGHDVCAVVTQPDRPKGRGQQLALSPVKEAAIRLGLNIMQPERVKRPEAVSALAGLKAEAMVVVGYGQIIPQSIIDLPPMGIINVHGSLLPAYRGAAPIQWAIACGETVTGNTTMRIDAGLDTGDILMSSRIEIGPEETAVELADRMSYDGARLLIDTLNRLAAGEIIPWPQDHDVATRAPILEKEDGRITWDRAAGVIHNRIRGFQPWPGGFTTFRGQTLEVVRARVAEAELLAAGAPPLAPGGLRVVDKRRLIAGCGEGTALELLAVKLEGRNRMPIDSFLNGQRITSEDKLGDPR
jgi:methionyl-tRNA formyltransferase